MLTWLKLNTASGFIDPAWFNRHRNRSFDLAVGEDGAVEVEGERLVFSTQALPPGTAVRVTLGRWFECCKSEDWNAMQEARAQQDQAREERDRLRRNAHRDESAAFNSTIRLPVKWDVGIKDVLSGLTERSLGDGRNRATVEHIYLFEPIVRGRLRRNAGDFLCSTRGQNGKQWSGRQQERFFDGDGTPYQPKVTCSKCIEIARRFTEETSGAPA